MWWQCRHKATSCQRQNLCICGLFSLKRRTFVLEKVKPWYNNLEKLDCSFLESSAVLHPFIHSPISSDQSQTWWRLILQPLQFTFRFLRERLCSSGPPNTAAIVPPLEVNSVVWKNCFLSAACGRLTEPSFLPEVTLSLFLQQGTFRTPKLVCSKMLRTWPKNPRNISIMHVRLLVSSPFWGGNIS